MGNTEDNPLDDIDLRDPIVNSLVTEIKNYTAAIKSIDDNLNSIRYFDRDIDNYLHQEKVGIESATREKITQLAKELVKELAIAKSQVEQLKIKVTSEYSQKIKKLNG